MKPRAPRLYRLRKRFCYLMAQGFGKLTFWADGCAEYWTDAYLGRPTPTPVERIVTNEDGTLHIEGRDLREMADLLSKVR